MSINIEIVKTTIKPMAAILAAVDPLRTKLTIEATDTADGICLITVAAPDAKALWDKLHPPVKDKLAQPDVHKVVDIFTAINRAISRIQAKEVTIVHLNAWEVCRG